MRWKAGALLAQPFYGMYFPGPGEYDLDRDAKPDVAVVTGTPAVRKPGVQYLPLSSTYGLSDGTRGKIVAHPNVTKTFDENKHYLYPLPRTELLLNQNLSQNPGWQ